MNQDAAYALLALAAENMLLPTVLEPAPDPLVTTAGWEIQGYLVGTDALFRAKQRMALGDLKTYYGFLARSKSNPDQLVLVIRGTEGFIEWIEDGEFGQTPHPVAGRVEAGFWGIYHTMHYRSAGTEGDLIAGILAAAGSTGRVTVIGHSLGSALATYLAFDLAPILTSRLTVKLFASPRQGDLIFATRANQLFTSSVSYAYMLDLVPMVPIGLGYAPAIPVTRLGAGNVAARIRLSLWCNHHALSYAFLLDYDTAQASGVTVYRDCILAKV